MITVLGRLEVRWFRPGDLQQLCLLHRHGFPEEDWRKKDFTRFAGKVERTNVIKVLTVENSDQVVGALLYSLEESACRVRRITVHPDLRRQGLATFFINTAVIGKRSHLRRSRFTAKVRERDLTAQQFLAALGFVFDAKEARSKQENGDDWYLFRFQRPELILTQLKPHFAG